MPQVKPVAKIHAAAAYFIFVSRDPNQIAKAFNLKNTRTVHRWAETKEWQEVLDICGYKGDRTFQRHPGRDVKKQSGDLFENARHAYLKTIADGTPKHRRATVAAEAVGSTARKIRDWARRYGWQEESESIN